MRSRVSRKVLGRATVVAAVAAVGLAAVGSGPVAARPAQPGGPRVDVAAAYEVYDARSRDEVNAVAASGAAVDAVEHGVVEITATPGEVARIRALGFEVRALAAPQRAPGLTAGPQRDFPSRDTAYHNYTE